MPGTCYYDCGLLIDDDDAMYVADGGTNVSVAQLSADGLSQMKTQQVFNATDARQELNLRAIGYTREGATTTSWTTTRRVPRSSGRPDHRLAPTRARYSCTASVRRSPAAGFFDQGSLIQTQAGDWYFMSFSWAYPAGRLPVLAPITWGDDGFPILTTDSSGGWAKTYPNPLPPHPLGNWTGTDTFQGNSTRCRLGMEPQPRHDEVRGQQWSHPEHCHRHG